MFQFQENGKREDDQSRAWDKVKKWKGELWVQFGRSKEGTWVPGGHGKTSRGRCVGCLDTSFSSRKIYTQNNTCLDNVLGEFLELGVDLAIKRSLFLPKA